MARRILSLKVIMDMNDAVFHDFLGIFPSDVTKADRKKFLLKKLEFANLVGAPSNPKRSAAKVLRRVYEASGFAIADTTEIFIKPAQKTMGDLGKFIEINHFSVFREDD